MHWHTPKRVSRPSEALGNDHAKISRHFCLASWFASPRDGIRTPLKVYLRSLTKVPVGIRGKQLPEHFEEHGFKRHKLSAMATGLAAHNPTMMKMSAQDNKYLIELLKEC